MPLGQHKVGIFFVFSFFVGMGMMVGAATSTQCLAAIGVPVSPNCNWRGNPLAEVVLWAGLILVVVGFWAMLFRRPRRSAKPDPSVPDEDGFYPLKNQVGHGPAGYLDPDEKTEGLGAEKTPS
jgi:hypothetical protein